MQHRAGAEILPAGALLVLGRAQGVLYQFVNALVLRGGNGHHRHAKLCLQPVHVHGVAVCAHLVHHVQRNHHGNAQLNQLHGKVQIALDVGGVHNVDDAVRLAVY